jgi:CheY-like chemotaxis protein
MTKSATVLIVEDDAEIRNSLREVLGDEGYAVVIATNGKEALEALRRAVDKPKLIILDVMMPVMDAYQFREAQLKDGSLSEIPTVLLSADAKLPEKAAAAKTSLYLKKPVDLDELFSLVEKYCRV